MKCICISCFDHYATRMKEIVGFFASKQFDVLYVISDFQHFEKKRFVANYDNCVQVRVPSYKSNLSIKRLLSHHVFSREVFKILKRQQPDVIYCMFPPNSLVKAINKYKKKHDVRVIFDCYDMWPESFPYSRLGFLLKLPFSIWRNLREKNIGCADMLVCVSKSSEDYWNNKHPSIKTKVLMPAITIGDIPKYSFDVSSEINFCYLGNINHIIDIDFAVEFLSKIANKKKTILHLIGDGIKKIEFVEKLEKNNVNVISYGVVFDEEQKKDIFAKCALALNIPRKEIHSTMPLKGIEYLQKGIPFVNTGEGDIANLVNLYRIGFNVSGESLNETVNKIISIDTIQLKEMSNNCQNCYLERFANQNLEFIFENVISTSNK